MAKEYKTEDGVMVLCQSLTFGYLSDIDNDIISDDMLGAILNGTNLGEAGVRNLLRPDSQKIWEIIKRETYPEMYEADGSEKVQTEEPKDNKKKA